MPIAPLLAFFVVVAALTQAAQAQAPAPAGPKNLVGNGGFETSFRRENLWDGVDNAGYLTGERGALPVLTTSGTIADTSMPVSVSVADMNGDGKMDIVTMDVLGYLRIYFNSGTPQEPAFELGDLGNIFLTRIAPKDPVLMGTTAYFVRQGPRVHVTEMLKTGKKDLIIGNYAGEILALTNSGSNQVPDFRQPADVGRIAIPTTKEVGRKWGNVFAPATWDWNKDGREDLLLGEGSYSANNIHLLLNMGSGNKPVFDDTNRHILAFGDGLEQLTPCVVDYNGDGLPDLLVAERTGKIAVYINKGEQWKSGQPVPEIPFASFLTSSSGSPISVGGIATIATGDFNGDGLFDIVVGKSNGRVALALNKGTKTEPKFDAPVEIKGTTGTAPMAMPSGWDVDFGLRRGNMLAYVSVVNETTDPAARPVEGKSALKVGYSPNHNKVLPAPNLSLPGFPDFKLNTPLNFTAPAEDLLRGAPSRMFMLRQVGRFRLKTNTNYTFSMRVKGKANEGEVIIAYNGIKELGPERVVKGDRDSAVVQRNEAKEENVESVKFAPGGNWSEVKKDFKVAFKNKDLSDLKEATTSMIQLTFTVPPGSEVYFDDVKIIEKP